MSEIKESVNETTPLSSYKLISNYRESDLLKYVQQKYISSNKKKSDEAGQKSRMTVKKTWEEVTSKRNTIS